MLAEALLPWAGTYLGQGTNHEGEAFTGQLRLKGVVGGLGLRLHFRALLADGTLVHEEESLISHSLEGGWTLWCLNTNAPGAYAHKLVAGPLPLGATQAFVFEHGNVDDITSFRERITLSLHPEGALGYAYAWGLPGGEFAERSGLVMKPRPDACLVPGGDARLQKSFLEGLQEFATEAPDSAWPKLLAAAQANWPAYVAHNWHLHRHPPKTVPNVPYTEYWVVASGHYIGRLGLRHELDEELRQRGGHIGYEIRPSWRGQGYGHEALRLGLEEARRLGLPAVLLTCKADNLASVRVIEAQGGRMEDEVDGWRRYWIHLEAPVLAKA